MDKEEKKLTPPKGPVGPEEERETRLRAEKAKIEAETKKKIEMERRREKVLGFTTRLTRRENLIKIGIGVIVLIVVIIGGFCIAKWIKSKPEPVPPTPPPVEVEKPPEGFEIQVEEVQMISTNGEYDVIAKIKNTDPNWGVSKLGYIFQLLDAKENVVGEKNGTTFILPLSKRSIIEVGIACDGKAQRVTLELDSQEVQKLKSVPDLGISSHNVIYNLVEGKTKGKVTGVLLNEGPYSFERVYLNIVLYSGEGKILGLNHTYVGNLLIGQERYFSAIWTKPLKVWVDRVEVEPLVDLFKSTAFIKEYGEGEPLEY